LLILFTAQFVLVAALVDTQTFQTWFKRVLGGPLRRFMRLDSLLLIAAVM
jgi:hypothetical protein